MSCYQVGSYIYLLQFHFKVFLRAYLERQNQDDGSRMTYFSTELSDEELTIISSVIGNIVDFLSLNAK